MHDWGEEQEQRWGGPFDEPGEGRRDRAPRGGGPKAGVRNRRRLPGLLILVALSGSCRAAPSQPASTGATPPTSPPATGRREPAPVNSSTPASSPPTAHAAAGIAGDDNAEEPGMAAPAASPPPRAEASTPPAKPESLPPKPKPTPPKSPVATGPSKPAPAAPKPAPTKASEAKPTPKPDAPAAYAGDKPCRAQSFEFPEVERACREGGVPAAKSLMKKAIQRAHQDGKRLKCKSCHDNLKTYSLESNAVADLKAWL